jgi:hypothetical protein
MLCAQMHRQQFATELPLSALGTSNRSFGLDPLQEACLHFRMDQAEQRLFSLNKTYFFSQISKVNSYSGTTDTP